MSWELKGFKTGNIRTLIKTITKFSNEIGSHQPDFSTNRVCVMLVIGQCSRTIKGTVNKSYLRKWTERVMCALLSRIPLS